MRAGSTCREAASALSYSFRKIMYGQNIQHFEPIFLLLLLCIAVLATLAKRFKLLTPLCW